ncbi:MAG: succinylglutamate desuccinylase/aspartoacylase family protein [Bacteroidota bacterium]
MARVFSKALNEQINFRRIIGQKESTQGPTIVIMAGIHGNEPAGIIALQRVFDQLDKGNKRIKGNLMAIAGHLRALDKGIRFFEKDLNRAWSEQNLQLVRSAPPNQELNKDLRELREIDKLISDIIKNKPGPFYFFDIHTTSSDSIPFITLNDTLVNRRFARHYPSPIILGIEEHLEGPFLNYVNSLGYISLGFEAGQHDTLESIENAVAFIFSTLTYTGSLDREFNCSAYENRLQRASKDLKDFFEIRYRKPVFENDGFKMKAGYVNFQMVDDNEELAKDNEGIVKAELDGRILMPLYQNKGDDGFFLIRRTRKIALWLSKWLRKISFDSVLTLLPGVRWSSKNRDALIIDLKVARYLAIELFHLLGYRNKSYGVSHMIVKKREASSKYKEYKSERWY